MNGLQSSSCECDLKLALKSDECEPTHFRNNYHSVKIQEELQSLRKNEVLCDIRFQKDDGKIVFAYKNVLMAGSPYLCTMLSNIDETNKDLVNIRVLDSSVLQKLVDYVNDGGIMVAKENVQVLLSAANLLQLDIVNGGCVEFLQKGLNQSSCLCTKVFADLHNCTELLPSSDSLLLKQKQFLEVIKCDEFIFLSSTKDVVKIIFYNDLIVEKKVFKTVISGLKHDFDQGKKFLAELIVYLRLSLLGANYMFETLHFNLNKSVLHFTIPQMIRCKLREFGDSQKVILMFKRSKTLPKCNTEWYDPATKVRKNAPGMNDCRQAAGLGVIRDQFVFAVGGMTKSSCQSVTMLDASLRSSCWVPMANMLISRKLPGVGVLNDCIYVVGGYDGTSSLNSVEVFDVSVKKWRMVSSFSITRKGLGVGVLNNQLYAVGGANGGLGILKSVECYDPSLDKWTPVSEMSEYRVGVGVGVLDGTMYAIGGFNGSEMLKSVEIYRPNDGVWSLISEMHLCRCRPGVVTLNGLLYVIGGETEISIADTVEIYNPKTNTWSMETLSRSGGKIYGGVVVDRSPNFMVN